MSTPFYMFKEIIPPKDRFWADPHVIQADGHYYVFVEEYIYRTRRAHISVIEMDEQGNCQEPIRVLEKNNTEEYSDPRKTARKRMVMALI